MNSVGKHEDLLTFSSRLSVWLCSAPAGGHRWQTWAAGRSMGAHQGFAIW